MPIELLQFILLVLLLALAAVAVFLQILWRPRRQNLESLRTLDSRLDGIQTTQLRHDEILRTELGQVRQETGAQSREGRSEILELLQRSGESTIRHLTESQNSQSERLQSMTEFLSKCQIESLRTFSERLDKLGTSNEAKLEQIRTTVDNKLSELREDNAKRLEQMRSTVDEKLQGTLEKRLGESFRQVSERLEQVHRGLGEMQTLAIGVGDLKKVLTNVKSRGGWGEVQLGALLEQILIPSQFERNVRTKDESPESVEYAIRLPGRSEDEESATWLPIDSKFPREDYDRLIEAQERVDPSAIEDCKRSLRVRVLQSAKDICLKYLNPPATTDFAIMFVPTEGLFAEIVSQNGLIDEMQSKYRVVAAGPTTFAALLNSLQMGFRTLAVQKQSSEVWKILGEVKTEFCKFGESLDMVKKKLQEASNRIDDVGQRSRALERRLRKVEELPPSGAKEVPDTALTSC
jgi:DNA recombination protein RmuC